MRAKGLKKLIIGFGLLAFGWGPGPAGADTVLVRGYHSVTYDIINPRGLKDIPDYSNQSFSQKVVETDRISKKLRVEIKLDPLPPTGPFPVNPDSLPLEVKRFLEPEEDIPSDNKRIIEMAAEITKGSRNVEEAFNRIIDWVMDYLEYEIDTAQDAYSVLKKRKASCVGFSNLSLSLLRAAGIPARYVSGYLPPGYDWGISQDYWGVKTSGGGFHAWIEVYLPGAGWVFTDAQHSKAFVDPFHVLLGIRGMEIGDNLIREGEYISVDDGTSYTVAEEENLSEPMDKLPQPAKKLLGRMGAHTRTRGKIMAKITNENGKVIPESKAVLWQEGKGLVNPASDSGVVVILGLEQGTYDITCQAPGFASRKEKVEVERGKTSEIKVILEEGGEIIGRVEDTDGKPLPQAKIYIWDGAFGTGYPVENDGKFRISNLSLGEVKISARANGGFIEEKKKVTFKKGLPAEVNFQLEQGGILEGKIFSRSGKPIGNGKVFIWAGDRGVGYPIRNDGTYSINGVKPGEYKISVRSPKFIEEYQNITVIKGQVLRTDFSLEEKEF